MREARPCRRSPTSFSNDFQIADEIFLFYNEVYDDRVVNFKFLIIYRLDCVECHAFPFLQFSVLLGLMWTGTLLPLPGIPFALGQSIGLYIWMTA